MLQELNPSAFPLRLEGEVKSKELLPIVARVKETVSEIPVMEVDFFCENGKLPLEEIVGKTMHLVAESEDGSKKRWFRGTCISAEFVGSWDVGGHYRAEVRPWLWFLTRRTDLRIFQEKNVFEIIQKVLEEHGYSGQIKNNLSGDFKNRTYCTQYRETDFAFISRLMEEEGIYYFFEHDKDTEKMVLGNSISSHKPVEDPKVLEFSKYMVRAASETIDPLVFEWNATERKRSGKVTLRDFDFENITADLHVDSEIKAGPYTEAKDNRYDYPGHYRNADLGEQFAKIKMEAEAVKHHVISGLSDAVNLAVGHTFTVTKLERTTEPKEVMLLECQHEYVQLKSLSHADTEEGKQALINCGVNEDHEEPHLVTFKAIDASKQYRAPLVTPWPVVGGIHTAFVTGPSGEEIHTDEFGRIKVQFHWDLDGNKDDRTTCWVRTMMPWTGKNWGAIAVPRVGQEVVIDYEEGDPDRPMCIGMLYNDKMMPPYKLPDNKTQSGVKTNSSKGGGGFNELMFEDKKGEELVRFQAEKDYKQIVKDNADITIGLEKKGKGDLNLTVHNDVTEVIKEGNFDQNVKKGKAFIEAKQSITLKCGESTIKLTPSAINIESKKIKINGQLAVDVTSSKTSVNGSMNLKLTGAMVNIN